MGEAWFMTEKRRTFDTLLGDLNVVPFSEIAYALGEITSGTGSFGPNQEWTEWYHYLLAHLVHRANESLAFESLLELFISGFIAIYPRGISGPKYAGFAEDVMATLGRSLMAADRWHGGQIVAGSILQRHRNPKTGIWGWYDASGDFSASMVFHIKYVPLDSLQPWLQSVLAIDSPHWRAQVLVWFVGARRLLIDENVFPADLESSSKSDESGYGPDVGWGWSHALRKEAFDTGDAQVDRNTFLSREVRMVVLDTLKAHFSTPVFETWLSSIASVDYLEAELANIPFTFWEQYGTKST